jgi:hypothetical protein
MHTDLESCVPQNFRHASLSLLPDSDFLDADLFGVGLEVYVNHAYGGDFWGGVLACFKIMFAILGEVLLQVQIGAK